ncbi:MAG: SRPBCC family protein [Acidimicrobiales bacterium]|nr:SRPBCC family protein [Acidimicrobiales bacterium]
MELTNDFRVTLPVEQAWAVLTDLELIAPCMPGAQLQEVEGDIYRGIVKIKVGPITAQYKGQVTFLEQDVERRVAVLRAEGRETRGQGSANATITATLTPDGDGTAVSVGTDLTVTGKVAQFGRGALAEVSASLMGRFVTTLEQTVLAEVRTAAPAPSANASTEALPQVPGAGDATGSDRSATHAAAQAPPATTSRPPQEADRPEVRKIDAPESVPVDLLGAAGSPLAKRVAPVLAVVGVAWLARRLLRRRR